MKGHVWNEITVILLVVTSWTSQTGAFVVHPSTKSLSTLSIGGRGNGISQINPRWEKNCRLDRRLDANSLLLTKDVCKKRFHRDCSLQNSASAFLANTISISSNNGKALLYMFLLALQFGCQPVLTKKFTPSNINRSTVVLVQDVIKFIMAACMLCLCGDWSTATTGWNVKTWLAIAGIPAALYSVQNLATLTAYQKLDPLTFNVLNQTKTLSAALCCYFILGRAQSKVQIASLILLFAASLIIEKVVPLVTPFSTKSTTVKETTAVPTKTRSKSHTQGVLAVLLASFISGLAGAISQKSLQLGGRNSYLFTMELCVASTILLTSSLFVEGNKDAARLKENGFFHNWTPKTLIPILTNAAGGIVVGLVTKYAGAVKKGFALIFGLLLSGILQASMERTSDDDDDGSLTTSRVSKEQIVGGIMAAISLWMHSSFPHVPK